MDTIPYFLTFLLLIFSIWTFFEVKKHQDITSKKIAFIEIEIEKERNYESKLMSESEKIVDLEKNTQQQFLKIKIAILNLDFTLQEIL